MAKTIFVTQSGYERCVLGSFKLFVSLGPVYKQVG